MKHVSVYGSSDDLMEVGGDATGCDEYPGEAGTFAVAGLHVSLRYEDGGVWSIKVGQLDEDVPVTAEDVRLGVSENGYSVQLDMEVPDGAYVTQVAVEK